MYDKIICAIGLGSRERAERLLRTSSALLSPGGELIIVHVIERLASGHEGPDDWAVSVIKEAEDKLDGLCRRLGIIASIEVRTGTATHVSDILDRIFGSTVEYVIRHAECSVLVERANKSHDKTTVESKAKKA